MYIFPYPVLPVFRDVLFLRLRLKVFPLGEEAKQGAEGGRGPDS